MKQEFGLNRLNANNAKWLNTLKQFVGKRQLQKMVKHPQAICWLLLTNCLSVFDHSVGLALKGLKSVIFCKGFPNERYLILHKVTYFYL